MKLTSFNCTIEVSKDENGYSNNYYIDITDKGVSISHPYVTQSQQQTMFVTKLIHDFVAASIAFNDRVDRFNFDNHLEQYTIIASSQAETTAPEEISPQQALEELAALKKACSPEGSNSDQTSKVSTVEDELEARETGSDMD